ncbi:MAG: leucyl/phenylalanyl-tRNA--protein transferase [Candidatus Kapabacteria bacterium]|nr:leucyl/phenylalanyl-tRNA--protein transferase [Candidatus Kapabacteria bacterium]
MLDPSIILMGYQKGFFPMGDEADGEVYWHRPELRAVIPLEATRVSTSVRKEMARGLVRTTINEAFSTVILRCSQRDQTWITPEIIEAYEELHAMGYAHSVETWLNDELVGGLYGVAIHAAFFGESMFSLRSNASKIAFAALVDHLRYRHFVLLDTQYINDFTASLGAIEIPDAEYIDKLNTALSMEHVAFL